MRYIITESRLRSMVRDAVSESLKGALKGGLKKAGRGLRRVYDRFGKDIDDLTDPKKVDNPGYMGEDMLRRIVRESVRSVMAESYHPGDYDDRLTDSEWESISVECGISEYFDPKTGRLISPRGVEDTDGLINVFIYPHVYGESDDGDSYMVTDEPLDYEFDEYGHDGEDLMAKYGDAVEKAIDEKEGELWDRIYAEAPYSLSD